MKSLLLQLPNGLTLLNLCSGLAGILFSLIGYPEWVLYCVLLSLIADFLDGFVARWVGAASPIGKELDSLADVISFGALPAVILWLLLISGISGHSYTDLYLSLPTLTREYPWAFIVFIIAGSSAYRLAKFNLDTRQSDRFIGVPTPMNGMVVLSFHLIALQPTPSELAIVITPYFILGYTLLMSYLLVSEIPLIALKFKDWSWRNNRFRYLLLLISVLSLLLMGFEALLFILFAYILLSIIEERSQHTK